MAFCETLICLEQKPNLPAVFNLDQKEPNLNMEDCFLVDGEPYKVVPIEVWKGDGLAIYVYKLHPVPFVKEDIVRLRKFLGLMYEDVKELKKTGFKGAGVMVESIFDGFEKAKDMGAEVRDKVFKYKPQDEDGKVLFMLSVLGWHDLMDDYIDLIGVECRIKHVNAFRFDDFIWVEI